MKKFIYIFFSALLFTTFAYSQGEVEANKISRNDLYGTARGLSMGGAFGALGGDQTGVAINPAGIAVYRSSEIAGTINYSNESSKVGDLTKNASDFNVDNLGFVGYFPLRSNSVPVINFGFSYNKVKSFNKEISAIGAPNSSLMDYMAYVATAANDGKGVDPATIDGNLVDDIFATNAPWLSVLGFNSYLIDPHQDSQGFYYTPLHNEPVTNSIGLSERGSVNNYDFTVGTSIGNKFNIGASLSITDVYYSLNSRYSEEFSNGDAAGFDLRNLLTTEGAGVGAKLGIIYRPVNSLRFGLSYHTPVWYSLIDTYSAELEDNVTNYVTDTKYEPATTYSKVYDNSYRFKTPDKWVASVAGVFGNNFIASLDYELTNYNSMKYKGNINESNPEEAYADQNTFISEDYKPASTVRAGIEYRFTPQFSGRLGYAWMQNPYEADYKAGLKETAVVGSTTIYRIEGDTNYFTGGLGYKFNRNFYLDLAVVYKTQTDELYPYPNAYNDAGTMIVDGSPFTLTNNNVRGLLTLGYRF